MFTSGDRIKVKTTSPFLDLRGKVGFYVADIGSHLEVMIEGLAYYMDKADIEAYKPRFSKGDPVKVIRVPPGDDRHFPLNGTFVIEDFVALVGGYGVYVNSSHHHYAFLKNLMLLEAPEPPAPTPTVRPGYCASCNTAKAVFGVVCEPCFQKHRDEHRAQMWGSP